jgi:phage terminase large subunit-like protein
VYDLTVEHDHEFFAGDLLVSNCLAWLEELAAWRHLDDAWDHMRFGLRVGPRPHWVASTTPKPKPLIKQLHSGAVANVMLTHASYRDNPHISEDIKASLEERYAGTQLGRQELYGELIEEDENALWQHTMIDEARVRPGDVPDLVRITVGVDPSGGAGEQGIVVVGKSGLLLPGALPGSSLDPEDALLVRALANERPQHHGFVLDDRSCQLSPDGWGRRAVQAAIDWEADDIVVERNYGGDMAVATLRAAADALGVDIPIRTVVATRGKAVRAEPVAALTAQRRWHHAGEFPKLEDQMATWYPEAGWSPDRLDSAVWGAWHLKLVGTAARGQGSLGGELARKQIAGGRIR